ncbi:MAG: methylated-DNA--[protein]-cysteine S-methyltransferase [Verrucomicrobia bacterium]|nr:methylated-DNA--[protein]-cysteine S-methyltransferase [Verrucomicrobiota bacterium]
MITADGVFKAHYSTRGLARLEFPSSHQQDKVRVATVNSVPAPVRRWHVVTIEALKLALAGRTPKKLPRLDLSSGTAFQQQVWNALRQIAAGKTRSYGDIARFIGKPKAVRAVGGACGANPIPVFVPCHRVLAANHRLGGFSGGLDWKRKLLAREGVRFENGQLDMIAA